MSCHKYLNYILLLLYVCSTHDNMIINKQTPSWVKERGIKQTTFYSKKKNIIDLFSET